MLSHFWIAKPGASKFHDAYTYTFTDDQDSLSREYIENRNKKHPSCPTYPGLLSLASQ
jgi:hypothetical protein